MRLYSVLAATALLAISSFAHANTFSNFTLDATLANGSATGTLTLDETTGKFTASNINVRTGFGGNYTFSGPPTSSGFSYTDLQFASSTFSLYDFELALPSASLKDYAGGSLCTTVSQCAFNASALQFTGIDINPVTFGTLTLVPVVVATPEPPSLLLLGTGVLVLGGFLRKRPV